MTGSVPVLLLTGPTGVGKSTIGSEVFRLLREADVPSAFVDLAALGNGYPVPSDDPWNERLVHANLACTWDNFQRAGARRLVLCRVLEARSLLRRIDAAIAGAHIRVVRLRAPLEVLHARLRVREAADPPWYVDTASYFFEQQERAAVEDHVIDNDERSPADVAAEVLRVTGWLISRGPLLKLQAQQNEDLERARVVLGNAE